MSDDRMPPYDLDAEEAVLGSLLLDSEAILKIADRLRPDDFYRDKNRWVYEASCALYERNEAINQVTVAHELLRGDRLEALGGSDYLSHLIINVPTSVHVEHYARIVHRLSMMRNLISTAEKISSIGYDAPHDVEAALDSAESLLFELRDGKRSGGFVPLGDIINSYYEKVSFEEGASEDLKREHINTGFSQLDKLLGGMHPSNMLILAARPSMGKTSLAMNIARNAAVNQGARVAIFSLEMSREELAYRFISAESGVNNRAISRNQLNEVQFERVMRAFGILSETQIYIDDSGSLKDSDMKSKARRLQEKHDIDLIVIDYIQLMRSSRFTKNRVEEMTYISQSLKDLARETNAPVLALSQLSRAVEARVPRVPILSDLRDSGSIEQDADVVLFIYRDDLYYKREDWEREFPDIPYPEGKANIIIAKHRNGPTGEVPLQFHKSTTRFEDSVAVAPAEKMELL